MTLIDLFIVIAVVVAISSGYRRGFWLSWFLGLSLARVPSPGLSAAIQRATILRSLDSIAPRPPASLARVQAIIAGVNFPSAFSGLEPTPSALPLPASVNTPGIRAAASETLKVQGFGCGGIGFGSGFPVGPGMVLTNAHVVAGTRGTTV